MAQILVRDLDDKLVGKLKARAKRHHRSLQSEAKIILSQAAGFDFEQARQAARSWQKKLAGKKIPDTTKLIAEDRNR